MRKKHRQFGATLIELMAVFGTIAVLSGLLATVAFSVLRRSKATVCASNLGQIGKAMLGYASDFDDIVPAFITSDERDHRSHPTPMSGTEAWIAALGLYGASKEVFRCPADKYFGTSTTEFAGDSYQFTSYFVHSDVGTGYAAKGGGVTYMISAIDEPSYRVYAGDKAMADKKIWPDGRWQAQFYGAHGLMYNTVCMDGRVVYGRYDHTDGKWSKY